MNADRLWEPLLKVSPTAEAPRLCRRALESVLGPMGVSVDAIKRFQFAVGEAVTQAVERAEEGSTRTINLQFHYGSGDLLLALDSPFDAWIPTTHVNLSRPLPDYDSRDFWALRLHLIKEMVDHVGFSEPDQEGTRLVLTNHL